MHLHPVGRIEPFCEKVGQPGMEAVDDVFLPEQTLQPARLAVFCHRVGWLIDCSVDGYGLFMSVGNEWHCLRFLFR